MESNALKDKNVVVGKFGMKHLLNVTVHSDLTMMVQSVYRA